MSNQGPNGWPKPNLLKSTLEIIFVTTTIPILIVGITIFSTEDFVWSGGMIDKLVMFLGTVTTILYISLYCTLIYWIAYSIVS